jgi:hypothetical protein
MRSPVRFMGRSSEQRWWDVRTPCGWLVVNAGYFGRPVRLRVYWSPNATPWHHAARKIVGRAPDRECVCSPACLQRKFGPAWTDVEGDETDG